MKTYNNLWKNLCNFKHLQESYELAKKRKSCNPNVIIFDEKWQLNLCILLRELRKRIYKPLPLRKFVLRDPKTRVICVSNFRDRIVHHALVSILQPIFEPRFIHDSYASRKGKGTLTAIKRLELFLRQVTKNGQLVQNAKNNNQVKGYALKADIKQYFDTVNHKILLNLIKNRVKDENILWLAKVILNNYNTGIEGKGMPLGNWTSQFFANIYLNELDQYVKKELKTKYYTRYVDDFIILHQNKNVLLEYKSKINNFLQNKLKLQLHPNKCKITPLGQGITFLGFRIFYNYKTVRHRNLKKIKTKLKQMLNQYKNQNTNPYKILELLQSWNAYAMHGNTYQLRKKLQQQTEQELQKIKEQIENKINNRTIVSFSK
ncbi:group II intron reverse transcriptase domain-containing protein [Candidatus Woesearchaeota archaeon]|nr:group II intron reverse transcriptase domain-containing protein [Candidatus Woesearchaeota archaeon]